AAARKAAAGIGDLPDKGIRAKIDLAVKETNQGFVNSGVNTKVRLVHAAEVSFDESEMTPSEALSEMKDGKIGSVHAWRDTYKADLVVMLALYPREDVSGESLGVGYVMSGRYLDKQTLVYPFEHLGYSIVGVNYATGYYTFAHEMGHNMGLCHYYDVSTITAAESGGYAWKTTLFRSIMGPPAGVPRINYWSNPSVKYSGLATGGTGLDGSFVYGGNEATVLNWTRAIVAKFR
ncbi:MAG: reprolysin-like metallopeptidase, partial [Deltaproteobacteria bacterium]